MTVPVIHHTKYPLAFTIPTAVTALFLTFTSCLDHNANSNASDASNTSTSDRTRHSCATM